MKTILFSIPFLFIALFANAQSNPGKKMNEPSFYEERNMNYEEKKPKHYKWPESNFKNIREDIILDWP